MNKQNIDVRTFSSGLSCTPRCVLRCLRTGFEDNCRTSATFRVCYGQPYSCGLNRYGP